jgi:PTH1 family peptidyl-tRNA hydrolase
MTSPSIAMLIGLGNPGDRYEATRHNAGQWFIERLMEAYGVTISVESKMKSKLGRLQSGGMDVRVAVPTTYMNHSGQSVGALVRYFKIDPSALLVAHDEIDLPVGVVRLKKGGGHGGHNGLRDIIAHLKTSDFFRLRIGVGRPQHENIDVEDYVLKRPTHDEQHTIDQVIDASVNAIPDLLAGKIEKVMKELHTK